MFSVKEKMHIATELEKLLLGLNHPEMPSEKPKFSLPSTCKENWSWADIEPNWTFEGKEIKANPFNEISRNLHAKREVI